MTCFIFGNAIVRYFYPLDDCEKITPQNIQPRAEEGIGNNILIMLNMCLQSLIIILENMS
jgi:hypothetical protein